VIFRDVEMPADFDLIRRLWREYWDSLGFSDDFQDFGRELAGLPGDYVPPGGALILAMENEEPAGVVAMRRIDDSACEAKRLYVRPEYRGRGVGRNLLDRVIQIARTLGYRDLYGDTMPSMRQALGMYDAIGFERVGPYSDHPTPGAVYLRLRL